MSIASTYNGFQRSIRVQASSMCDILFVRRSTGATSRNMSYSPDLHTFQDQEINYEKALVKTHRVTPSCVGLGTWRSNATGRLSRLGAASGRAGPDRRHSPHRHTSHTTKHISTHSNPFTHASPTMSTTRPIAHCHTTCSAQGRGILWH